MDNFDNLGAFRTIIRMRRYTTRLRSLDRPGIVHAMTGVMLEHGANIVESAQFSDTDTGLFAMRTTFETESLDIRSIDSSFDSVRDSMGAEIELRAIDQPYRALIMVSKYGHCLLDLLHRHADGELDIDIPLIVSNHTDLVPVAERFGIPFEHLPVTPGTKDVAESRLIDLISAHNIDFVVLARYMQVLSDAVCSMFQARIINIHHAFLPAFKGSRPYHQAHERGVKLIGATAHYVTADLDEGPIIAQAVEDVYHSDSVEDLVRVGRDIERIVLSKAVRYHAEDRVILVGSRTIVFD